MRIPTALVVGFVLLSIFPAGIAEATLCGSGGCLPPTCPEGKRRATAEDAAVKNGQIQIGSCYSPTDVGIGEKAEEAKQYLKTLLRSSNRCTAPDQEIEKINPAFATCAARFLKEFNQRYGGAQITRAFNSVQCEAILCRNNPGCGGFNNNPAPQSNHTRGLAMDVSAGGKQETMISFANQNPQFGVCFPLSSWDKVHLVLAGIPGGERCSGPNKPCDGVTFDPSSIQEPPPISTSPTSQLSDAIRKALGQQPQQLPPPPPPPPVQIAQPTQTTPTTQTTTSTVSSQITPISSIINTNTNSNTNDKSTSTKATSTIDLIEEFLNPVSDSIAIGTAVDIDLNPDTSDATALNGKRPTSTLGTLVINQTLSVPQTFTSSDLANSPVSGSVTGQNTFALGLLETMKKALLYALAYLKPFGGYVPDSFNTY